MSTQIIPNCFHPDGTPCIAYALQADGGNYHYTVQPPPPAHQENPLQHAVPEPPLAGLFICALAVLATRHAMSVLTRRRRRGIIEAQ